MRAFFNGQSGDTLFASDVTFAEVRIGIELMPDPARRSDVAQWLDRTLRPLFEGRVLSVTENVLLRWRLMMEGGRKKGHTFSEPDLLIAALAALAGLIVVSRDASEFVSAGVPVFDPWTWTLHAGGRAVAIADADSPDTLSKLKALVTD